MWGYSPNPDPRRRGKRQQSTQLGKPIGRRDSAANRQEIGTTFTTGRFAPSRRQTPIDANEMKTGGTKTRDPKDTNPAALEISSSIENREYLPRHQQARRSNRSEKTWLSTAPSRRDRNWDRKGIL
jgi:hypothetical protein